MRSARRVRGSGGLPRGAAQPVGGDADLFDSRPMTAREELAQYAAGAKSLGQLCREYEKHTATVHLEELVGGALSFYAAAAVARVGGIHLFVAEDRDAAAYLLNDFYNLLDETRVCFFPSAYKRSAAYGAEDAQGVVQRTATMRAVRTFGGAKGDYLIVCTYPEALAERVADAEVMRRGTIPVRVGDRISIEVLEGALVDAGFTRVDFVYEPGQYSVRGGIVDVFSYSESKPYRLDFFGDEVDSIRRFNISSQLSADRLDGVEIIPDLSGPRTGAAARVSLVQFAGGGARLLVLRRRLRAAARERRAAPHAAGHGAARDDRRAADLAQRPARRHGPLPALPPARQPGGASRRRDDPLLDGSPAQVQQELRDAGRRHDPQLAARVRDAHPLGEQGADGAPRKHLPPDRPRAGRRAAALHHAARGLRRQRPEALPLYRSPDLRPLPALPHQRRDPARRADDRRRAQPAAPGRLRRAHRPRRRPLRRTGEDQRERQDARGDQARLQGRRRALRQRPLAAPHLALQVGRRRAAEGLQARHGGLAEAQERHEEGRQGHLAPAHRPLRQAQGLEGLRLLAGQLPAARARGVVPLGGYARPAGRDCGREARHGVRPADGPAHLRRRGFRQDRGGDPRRLQGRRRRQAGRRARADDDPRAAALPLLHRTAARLPGAGRIPQPHEDGPRGGADPRGPGRRAHRHPHRHAQDAGQADPLPRPGAAHHRRGAEVRRRGQGEAHRDERLGRYADAHGNAHPADAAILAHGLARPLGHLDAPAQPAADPHRVARLLGGDRARRHRDGAGAQRAGLLRPQPRRGPADAPGHGHAPLPEGPRGGGPRQDAPRAARETRHGLHLRGVRRADLDDDRRERHRHSERQYDHRRQRPELRPERPAPAARPRRTLEPEGLLLPAHASRRVAHFGCAAASAGHRGVFGPRFGLQHRHAGPRHPRRGQPAGRRAERLHRRHRLRDLPEDHERGDCRAACRRVAGRRPRRGGAAGR